MAVRAQIWLANILIAWSGFSSAMDVDGYRQLAEGTVRQMDMGVVGDIDEMLAIQQELIIIGVEGSVDYLVEGPNDAQALSLVVLNAEKMKDLSIDQIEAQWHGGEFLKGKGIDPDKIDHFGATASYMDSIIHPATTYILLREYKRTGNADLLVRVKAELLEVLEHIKHIQPNETQLTDGQQ